MDFSTNATLQTLTDQWRSHLLPSTSVQKFNSRLMIVNQFLTYASVTSPLDLTLYRLLSWHNYCYFHFHQATARSKVRAVLDFYSFLLEDWLDGSAIALSSLFIEPAVSRSFFAKPEFSPFERALVSFLFYTGVSFRELSAMTWDDITYSSGHYYLSLSRNHKIQYVLPLSLYFRLLAIRSPLSFCKWLFHSSDFQCSLSYLNRVLPVSWRSLYHTRNYFLLYDYYGISRPVLEFPEKNPHLVCWEGDDRSF